MSQYHYLVSVVGREYVCLFNRLTDGTYEGPVFEVDGIKYRIKGELLTEFVRKFRGRHPDAVIIPEEEAFGCGQDMIKEHFVSIDGDRDWDIRLSDHPLFTPELRKHVLQEGRACRKVR